MRSFTTSMPTPRPETSETSPLVLKPGRKIKRRNSSSDNCAPRSIKPYSMALSYTVGKSMPLPSSAQITSTSWPLRRKLSVTVPISDLPNIRRSSAVSRPWSTALRSKCSNGSVRRVNTSASKVVASPMMISCACLPVVEAVCATLRFKRATTDLTGTKRACSKSRCCSRSDTSSSRSNCMPRTKCFLASRASSNSSCTASLTKRDRPCSAS